MKVYAVRDRETLKYLAKGGSVADKPEKLKVSGHRRGTSMTLRLGAERLAREEVYQHNKELREELKIEDFRQQLASDEYRKRERHTYGEEWNELVEYYKGRFEIIEVEFP